MVKITYTTQWDTPRALRPTLRNRSWPVVRRTLPPIGTVTNEFEITMMTMQIGSI